MIHVSDIQHYLQCEKLAWNWKYNRISTEGFYHMDVSFVDLYKQFLKIENYVSGQTGDTNAKTLDLLENNRFILNARLEYNGCRCRIPVFEKLEEGYRIIYPFLSAFPKEFEANKMKMNQIICEKNGINIIDTKIVFINKDYVRDIEFDLDRCLCLTDTFFNKKNKPSKSINECLNLLEIDLDDLIQKTENALQQENIDLKRTKQCTSGRRCKFYDLCFDDSNEPDDSTLFLTTSQFKLDSYYSGVKTIKEMNIQKIEGFRLQYAQFMASKYGLYMDRSALIPWLDEIKYPISYLDFEWDTFAIPPYRGMKPFDVLCFQYSLHVEYEHKPLKHYDFFDYGDCREEFIKSLIESIPKEGTILVYNMEGAEKLRLIQLAEQFPKYENELRSIWERMIDLSKPFETGIFYHNSMRGHYSLKTILPVFSDNYSYSQLTIKNGMNAVSAYRNFEKTEGENREQIRHDISMYCAMDTFAEYVVYHGLQRYLKEIENA